jgi:hypothetical protein
MNAGDAAIAKHNANLQVKLDMVTKCHGALETAQWALHSAHGQLHPPTEELTSLNSHVKTAEQTLDVAVDAMNQTLQKGSSFQYQGSGSVNVLLSPIRQDTGGSSTSNPAQPISLLPLCMQSLFPELAEPLTARCATHTLWAWSIMYPIYD